MRTENSFLIEKLSERATSKAAAQVIKVVEAAQKANRPGWSITPDEEGVSARFKGGMNVYHAKLSVVYDGQEKPPESLNSELRAIAKAVAKADKSWKIVSIDGEPFNIEAETTYTEDGAEVVDYAPVDIPTNWRKHFDHIYGREAQIEVVLSYIRAAIDSNWSNRFHAALVGHPASGKTETARAFKRMLGEGAVMELDATGTTMAGAILALKKAKESGCVPRILIIEEIEKTDFKQFPWLLAMLDPRAEIRKINFKGEIHMEAKLLCIATINNYKLFNEAMEGALASRFADPIFFPRPDDDILQRILLRDVQKVDGNPDWIMPAIKFARELDITDPRHILAICLAGNEELMTGRYQAKLMLTRMPEEYRKSG